MPGRYVFALVARPDPFQIQASHPSLVTQRRFAYRVRSGTGPGRSFREPAKSISLREIYGFQPVTECAEGALECQRNGGEKAHGTAGEG